MNQENDLQNQTDFELVDRSLNGDSEAFTLLVQKYQRPIYFTALRMVSGHEEAADIAQQAFMNAFRSLRQFKRKSSFKTWLYQIVINLCRNHIKSETRRPNFMDISEIDIVDHSLSPLDVLEDKAQSRRVYEAMRKLPEKQRVAVILRVYEECSYQDIAKILGCLSVTARTHFHYGILNLRKNLEGV